MRLNDNYVNFMVMGDSGLGKTTFIHNLTDSYSVKAAAAADGSTTSLATFQTSPESLRTLLEPMDIPEAGRRLHVTIQDMPGWGDDINLVRYLKVVLSHILEQRAKDYELLSGSRAMNSVAMCGQLAHSITACVYFLPPHRVKKVDLILISAISQLVTVIPVVSKADTMTESELAQYRAEIRDMLSAPAKFAPSRSLPPLSFNGFEWSPEVMSTLGLDPQRMPLALVTSRDCDKVHSPALLSDLGLDPSSGGVSQPVRKYAWGTAYSLHREHSDLLLLKRLLMGDRVDSLYAMLDESYNRYTDFCAEYEQCGKQLPMLVQAACSLSTPYLEYDDYTKAQAALDAAQQAMASLMAENKSLLDRLSALERVAVRVNGVHAHAHALAPASPPQQL